MHFLVRFEPFPENEDEFREELLRVVEHSRGEAGCLAMHAFESIGSPVTFAIHSDWVDESAFEHHAQLPHTVRFLGAAERLLREPVEGLRLRQIGGGAGAAVTAARVAPSGS